MSNTPYEEIKAFIGHSFSEEDKTLIDKFLHFFKTLKEKTGLNFEWTHAVDAEPTLVSEKVKQLLEEKNLFIGICTKKELAFTFNNKKRFQWCPDFFLRWFFVSRWKTSDWILQEIGYAIGKEMKIILLVESGVDMSSGLQDNLEYITFKRDSPSEVFEKIIEMLSALTPKKSRLTIEASQEISPKEKSEEKKLKDEKGEDVYSYFWKFYDKIFLNDLDGARLIQQEYSATNISQEEKIGWEAHCEYIYLEHTNVGDLNKLKSLANNHPNNAEVLRYFASGLATYKSYNEAARIFGSATEIEIDPLKKINLLCLSAEMHCLSGEIQKAREVINYVIIEVQKIGDGEEMLLDTLSKLSAFPNLNFLENKELIFAIMERKLAINPDDINTRFSLAYKYSQAQRTDLALFHYLRIPEQKRNSSAWNNLGVAYQELGDLESKSVQAYKHSKALNETLAMSNLAIKYLEGGFIEEAKEECQKALRIEDYHPNILTTLQQVETISEKEAKKEEGILLSANPISTFYTKCGEALCRAFSQDLQPFFQGPDCNLSITLKDSQFEATGTYEKKDKNSLLGVLSGRDNSDKTCNYHIKYAGTTKGSVIEGIISHYKDGTLLSSSNATVLMIISSDATRIEVMELNSNNKAKFYTLEKAF